MKKVVRPTRLLSNRVVMTHGVDAEATRNPAFASEVGVALNRFVKGDWGDVDEEDWGNNNTQSVENGFVMAVYSSKTYLNKVWIISDGSGVTTILFPREY